MNLIRKLPPSFRTLSTFHINIPYPAPNDRRPQVQIPLLPDYWGAANHIAHEEKRPSSSSNPVMLTVASSDTHLTQPSHKLYQPTEDITEPFTTSSITSISEPGSLWKVAANAFSNERESAQQDVRPLKRELTDDEHQGLYILLALLGSSWLLGGLVERMERTTDHS